MFDMRFVYVIELETYSPNKFSLSSQLRSESKSNSNTICIYLAYYLKILVHYLLLLNQRYTAHILTHIIIYMDTFSGVLKWGRGEHPTFSV